MEYFDFEQAAQHDDDVTSLCQEIDESDVIEACDSLSLGKDIPPQVNLPAPQNNAWGGASDLPAPGTGIYPMNRAKEPCDLCRSMGLDCFTAKRGVMQKSGCTCCISLYRECSFTHAKPQGKFLDTLHVVSEDAYVPTGGLTGKIPLKSVGGGGLGTMFEDPERRQRKAGARFSREAVKVLKTWLSEHASHPYPTDEEKDHLKLQTGLKRSQICNWLANARRRGKVRSSQNASNASVLPGAMNIPGSKLAAGVDPSELTPFERWRHSPPEHEAAAATDIIRAMATTQYDPPQNHPQPGHVRSYSRKTGSSNDGSSFSNMRIAPSMSSFSLETTKSSLSDMSFASAFSHRSSHASFNSMDTKERRRRRQKSASGHNSFNKGRSARIYKCTFCSDSFPTKYDWQRHEKSLHLALDQWTCAPQGGILSVDGALVCAFCRQHNPDQEHLETHNCAACQEKTLQERTFYRKDHLNQHLRLMHGVKYGPWMDAWKRTTNEIKSRCGICSATFNTWKDRVDHLAGHFKAGVDMTKWKGDWGFEPQIQWRVENSMPPYLIGQDAKTLDPYVAQKPLPNPQVKRKTSQGDSSKASSDIAVPMDMSCFRRLEIELSAFIAGHLARGTVPTDRMIQDEARKTIYGTDDQWNQTCADNPVWLAVLKRDNGICDLPEAQDINLLDLGMKPPFAANGGLRKPPEHTARIPAPSPITPGFSSPGLHSAGFQNSGCYSGAPSIPGSFNGSATGSVDASSAGLFQGLSAGWPTKTSGKLSSSAPVTAPQDPLAQMDFEANFLQQLNGSGDNEEIDSMNVDASDLDGNPGFGDMVPSEAFGSMQVPSSAPISIPAFPVPTSTSLSGMPESYDPQQSSFAASFNRYARNGSFRNGSFNV